MYVALSRLLFRGLWLYSSRLFYEKHYISSLSGPVCSDWKMVSLIPTPFNAPHGSIALFSWQPNTFKWAPLLDAWSKFNTTRKPPLYLYFVVWSKSNTTRKNSITVPSLLTIFYHHVHKNRPSRSQAHLETSPAPRGLRRVHHMAIYDHCWL